VDGKENKMKIGDKIKVIGFNCGRQCTERFQCMGIFNDVILEVISIQPFGPVVVKVKESEYTIGRGMLEKLKYEVINDNSS